jgi:hypothetical protein
MPSEECGTVYKIDHSDVMDKPDALAESYWRKMTAGKTAPSDRKPGLGATVIASPLLRQRHV